MRIREPGVVRACLGIVNIARAAVVGNSNSGEVRNTHSCTPCVSPTVAWSHRCKILACVLSGLGERDAHFVKFFFVFCSPDESVRLHAVTAFLLCLCDTHVAFLIGLHLVVHVAIVNLCKPAGFAPYYAQRLVNYSSVPAEGN